MSYNHEVKSYEGLRQNLESRNLRDRIGKEVGAQFLQALGPTTSKKILNRVSDVVDGREMENVTRVEAFVFLHAIRGTRKSDVYELCQEAGMDVENKGEIDRISTNIVRKQII